MKPLDESTSRTNVNRLSLIEPVYAAQRIELDYIYELHRAEMLSRVKEMLADTLQYRLEPYGVKFDERDVIWTERTETFMGMPALIIEGLWAGKPDWSATLHGGPHDGSNFIPERDRRGIPRLHWMSHPDPYPGATYKRRGIDPEFGGWHYYYEGA